MAEKSSKEKMLQNMPADLTKQQQTRYQKLWQQNPKQARQFLKKKGYDLQEVRQANNAEQEEGAENPYQLGSGSQAINTSMEVANEQAQQQMRYNRPDQQGLYGGQEQWVQNEDGSWSKQQSFGDNSQQMVDYEDQFSLGARRAGSQAANRAWDNYQDPYSWDGISDVYGEGDLAAGREKAAKNVFDSGMRRLQPGIDQKREDFEQMAAERGWTVGSDVYEKEKTRMESQIGDQTAQLESSAWDRGMQEHNNMYNQSVDERGRQIGEYNTMRNQPFQESQMLMSSGPGARMDQFSDYGPVNVQQTNPMEAYGIDSQKYINDSNLSWEQRKQQVQNRWQAKQDAQTRAWQSGESAADRASAMSMAQMNRPRGPALSPQEEMQMARDQMIWEQENGFRPPPGGWPQDSGGSGMWGGIAGSVGSGIGQGIGSGIANWWNSDDSGDSMSDNWW